MTLLDTYIEETKTASLFPTKQQVCHRMAKRGVNPNEVIPAGYSGEILNQAGMNFLSGIREEVLAADPTAFMDNWEKMDYLKKQQKNSEDKFDNSPCPPEEMASLEGVGDAEDIMDRALTLAGGNVEKLADVLEHKDKMTSKWRRSK
jgi:hypothetical protein